MSPVGERDVIRMGIPRELLGKFYEKWGIFWLDLGNFDICGWQHWSGDVSAVDLTSSVKRSSDQVNSATSYPGSYIRYPDATP